MKVTLLSFTPEPDRVVATAARLCYSPRTAEELWGELTLEKQKEFLAKLWSYGHYSPFEHVTFTFALSGVSRALSHQLVRHRIASYAQRSQRYINETDFPVVIPPTIQSDVQAEAEFTTVIRQIREGYKKLVALGIPKEDARYLLPNACATQLLMSMNARSLFNFLSLRCCRRAQWEIRELAWEIRRQVLEVAPLIFAQTGPPCLVKGKCPEGPLTCGEPYTREEVEEKDRP
ncbi:MAG: FAD-dependent thymidylate synthase [Firmicutes bacterium]|nr:FAD-dependent thymidylate synthase [Bacillota bacterium]